MFCEINLRIKQCAGRHQHRLTPEVLYSEHKSQWTTTETLGIKDGEHIMYADCVATKNNPMDQRGKDHYDRHQTPSKAKY